MGGFLYGPLSGNKVERKDEIMIHKLTAALPVMTLAPDQPRHGRRWR